MPKQENIKYLERILCNNNCIIGKIQIAIKLLKKSGNIVCVDKILSIKDEIVEFNNLIKQDIKNKQFYSQILQSKFRTINTNIKQLQVPFVELYRQYDFQDDIIDKALKTNKKHLKTLKELNKQALNSNI